ncbi:hypothetical protein EDD27_6039 [Nonomuraea polychroma]|uniref:Response regulatory domain-containing protein n=1 Tax=Nonomuraea polychroma TaxID=46176 RepID=A0A438MCE1_9ACTN|nr:hypothetical protein EDD27_6039 [Nonomuraea polychroma]
MTKTLRCTEVTFRATWPGTPSDTPASRRSGAGLRAGRRSTSRLTSRTTTAVRPVGWAANGDEAVWIMRRLRPDIALLDLAL